VSGHKLEQSKRINNMQDYHFDTLCRVLLSATCLVLPCAVQAEWSAGGAFSTYYTDDVGLFSVTRRLSLDEDPTQPIVDEPQQGADVVYEPSAYVNWATENKLGDFELELNAGAYIFQNNSEYTHGFLQLIVEQELTEKNKIKLLYDFVPQLYIGKKSLSQEGDGEAELEHEAGEQLDSHIWSMHLEHELSNAVILRGLVRYGIREYNQPFAYRDTQFFTVGSHLEWVITHDIELLVGYHFERGYTDHKQSVKYQDDIGYINHFASAELKIHLLPDLEMILIFDYEHNDFTSPFVHDIHYDGNENVYQGEIEFLYELTEQTMLKAGWQHGSRKFNYESHDVHNNNVWVAAEFHF
jgi:hypothetical protein